MPNVAVKNLQPEAAQVNSTCGQKITYESVYLTIFHRNSYLWNTNVFESDGKESIQGSNGKLLASFKKVYLMQEVHLV